MIHRVLGLLLLAFAVGCSPTRTPGTENCSPADLAVLTVDRHAAAVPGVKFDAVKIESVQYDVGRSSDFYLTPGDHEIEVGITYDVPGVAALFTPTGDLVIFIPASTGPLIAGKHYQLRPWDGGAPMPLDFITHVAVEVTK